MSSRLADDLNLVLTIIHPELRDNWKWGKESHGLGSSAWLNLDGFDTDSTERLLVSIDLGPGTTSSPQYFMPIPR